MHTLLALHAAPSSEATSAVCMANSRVGDTTSTIGDAAVRRQINTDKEDVSLTLSVTAIASISVASQK
jgi:hypothetical protein